jgi:hypothetical protein
VGRVYSWREIAVTLNDQRSKRIIAWLQKLPRNHNGVMQRKAAQTSGGLQFVATGCVRADAYFMLLSFDSSLTVALSS